MSETDLAKALLSVDALSLAAEPDVRIQTWAILERDRRRVRRLTAVTVATWLLGFGLLAVVVVGYGLWLPRQAQIRQQIQEGKLKPAEREDMQFEAQKMTAVLSVGIGWALMLLGWAMLFTVLLLFASRRATLRQVNASLLEVSRQVKELRAALPPSR
jgi:hypothetical protein